jgi:hypothetical protein
MTTFISSGFVGYFTENEYKNFVENPERVMPFGRPRIMWEDLK